MKGGLVLNNYINHNRNCNMDCGPEPFVTNIANAARCNTNYRSAIWTGCNLQCTLMCIPAEGDIGLEKHSDTDQCLIIECGRGMCCMGPEKDRLNFQQAVCENSCVFVPAGTWHNITKVRFLKSPYGYKTE